MVLGAAIGGAVPNVPAWVAAYETGSAGGILAAMLTPAKGFGKFIVVILAFSTLGNMAASTYSVSLNFQMIMPFLIRVPRGLFSLVIVAVYVLSITTFKRRLSHSIRSFQIVSYQCRSRRRHRSSILSRILLASSRIGRLPSSPLSSLNTLYSAKVMLPHTTRRFTTKAASFPPV